MRYPSFAGARAGAKVESVTEWSAVAGSVTVRPDSGTRASCQCPAGVTSVTPDSS